MAKPKKTGSKIKVDFKGVESGGKLVPEGDYTVRVDEVTQEESDAGNAYLAWVLKVADGKHKGSTLYHNTSLQPQALWNLKGVLEALGVEVPDSSLDVDLKELVGMTANVTVEHETYQGKPKARIVAWESGAGGDDEEEEEEESSVTADDVNEMDDEELEALVENNELDVKLSKLKNIKARRTAVIEALGLNEQEEESDDEGDEEAAEKDEDEEEGEEAEGDDEEEEEGDDGYTDEQINEMGKPELAALVKKHKLKVTLEGTTAQQRRAVKKALIRAELFNAEEA